MIDVLCAMFSGAPFGPDIPKMYGDLSQRRGLGGLVGAIDIGRFVNPACFGDRVAELTTRLGRLKITAGTDRVYYPGEPEMEAKASRQICGIPISVELFAQLNAMAGASNAAPLQPLPT